MRVFTDCACCAHMQAVRATTSDASTARTHARASQLLGTRCVGCVRLTNEVPNACVCVRIGVCYSGVVADSIATLGAAIGAVAPRSSSGSGGGGVVIGGRRVLVARAGACVRVCRRAVCGVQLTLARS
jgi:hypothetical protein